MGITNLFLQLVITVFVLGIIAAVIGFLRKKRTGYFHEREEDRYPRDSGTWGGG